MPEKLQDNDLDKLQHIVAYGIITLFFVLSLRNSFSLLSTVILFFTILIIATLDECTQPFVNRQASLIDWLADMIGIVVVTHSGLGEALIEAAESIMEGNLGGATAVSVDLKQSAEDMRKKISGGIKKVDKGRGVLILTDMFGGTPSNLSLSFLEEGRIEVLTGVNLPLVIRAAKMRKDKDLKIDLETESQDEAIYLMDDDHQRAMEIERRIEEKYPNFRIQSYRTEGKASGSEHLRMYLVYKPKIRMDETSPEKTDIQEIACQDFLKST